MPDHQPIAEGWFTGRLLIVGVQILQQTDELDASVAVLDARRHVPIMQVQPGQYGPCAISDVFMIAGHGGMFVGHRRQVWRRVADGLYTGLFIHRDGDHQRLRPPV